MRSAIFIGLMCIAASLDKTESMESSQVYTAIAWIFWIYATMDIIDFFNQNNKRKL